MPRGHEATETGLAYAPRGEGGAEGQGSSVTPSKSSPGGLDDPHSAISINNAQYIVDNPWTHWGEANILKRTPVIHHQVFELQALKTTRTTVL